MAKKTKRITKRFGADFTSDGGALTLDPSEVSSDKEPANNRTHTRKHKDGWTITGVVHEDWYSWVNEFEAVHPKLGRVWGDFEKSVHASSEEAFLHFYKRHAPTAWDYGDI